MKGTDKLDDIVCYTKEETREIGEYITIWGLHRAILRDILNFITLTRAVRR